jgi:hypothetical protein
MAIERNSPGEDPMQIAPVADQTTDQIAWTALPNGVEKQGASQFLKLSVLISPRMLNATYLPKGFETWPQTLLDQAKAATQEAPNPSPLAFDVDFLDASDNRLPDFSRTGIKPPLDHLRPDLWTALFGDMPMPSSRVSKPAPLPHAVSKYQNQALTSFNVRYSAQTIRNKYSSLIEASRTAAASAPGKRFMASAATGNVPGAVDLFSIPDASARQRQAKAQAVLNSIVNPRLAGNLARLNLSPARPLKAEGIFALLTLSGETGQLGAAGYINTDAGETARCTTMLELLLFHRRLEFDFYLSRHADPGDYYHNRIASAAADRVGDAAFTAHLKQLSSYRMSAKLRGETIVALMVNHGVAAGILRDAGVALYPAALIARFQDAINLFFAAMPAPPPARISGVDPTLLDFNERIAMLHGHPAVQRALGLVFDLLIPISDLAGLAAKGPGAVRLTPHSHLGGFTDKRPLTNYDLLDPAQSKHSQWRFWARATPLLGDGMLNVQISAPGQPAATGDPDANRRFHLEAMDVDGAVEKASRREDSAARAATYPAPDQKPSGDPSLRSAGISMVMTDRKAHFAQKISNPPSPHLDSMRPLNAEDVLLGYRVDIWEDKTASWHSLCKRDGRYSFTATDKKRYLLEPRTPQEKHWLEGVVQLGATVPTDGTQDVRVHEALFRWDNWSLAVKFEDADTINTPPSGPHAVDPQAKQPLRLEGSFEVENGSLPPLRFGVGYFVRCRAVDLAGNGLAFEDCDDVDNAKKLGAWDHSGANPVPVPFVYRRYEPVASPLALLWGNRKLTPGEQMSRLVIRNGAKSDKARRVIVPPRVAQSFAELHGMFDGSLDLPEGAFPYVHLNDDASFPMVGTDKIDTNTKPQDCDGYFSRSSQANPDPPAVRYFPDPYARATRIDIYDRFGNQACNPQIVPFYLNEDWPGKLKRDLKPKEWPQALEFFIEMVPSANSSIYCDPISADFIAVDDERHRQRVPKLTIHVPAGEQAQIQLSSHFGSDGARRLRNMALFSLASTDDPAFREHAVGGMNSLFTPPYSITLVHALVQPRDVPEWRDSFADRVAVSDTAAQLKGLLISHAQSTSRLDLNATWNESVDDPKKDDPQQPGPRVLQGSFNLPTTLNAADNKIDWNANPAKQEFNDTKFRRITYQLAATSAYREYFSGSPNTVRTGAAIPKDIRSSARPKAPFLAYSVPAFSWARTHTKHRAQSTRGGGVVRVYMKRGWYSSGDDELLAAVLWPDLPKPSTPPAPNTQPDVVSAATAATFPNTLQHLVTQWGADPIWKTSAVPHFPAYQHFRNAVDYLPGLTLSELEGSPNPPTVAAVAFRPEFDFKRMLWYCDIDLGQQISYFPFIRLALTRFQRNSLSTSLVLSPVVLSDFMQLTPTRVATVEKVDKQNVRVTIRGVTLQDSRVEQAISSGSHGSLMCITVEEQAPFYGDSNAGWLPAPGVASVEIAPIMDGGEYVWTTTIPLRKFTIFRPRRILVREIERYFADDPANRSDPSKTIVVPRVVYMDVLPVVK